MRDLSWVCFQFQWDEENHTLASQTVPLCEKGTGINKGSSDSDIRGRTYVRRCFVVITTLLLYTRIFSVLCLQRIGLM